MHEWQFPDCEKRLDFNQRSHLEKTAFHYRADLLVKMQLIVKQNTYVSLFLTTLHVTF